MRGFAHIETWVFDLDNTLYPASCRLFDQIEPLLRAGVREAAGRSLLEFQTLLNLSEDESLFVVTLGVGTSPRAGPHSPEHGNFGEGMP